MRRAWLLGWLALWIVVGGRAFGQESVPNKWRRIDSRYCTMWLHPEVETKQVSKKVSTWRLWPRAKGSSPEEELVAKCDTLFQRAQEILDMYPPGIHTTIRISRDREEIKDTHASRYGFTTEAIAFYVFENNTIYTTAKDISESVLAHEMAHCIVDHYFRMRPPRKIEEMLAMHVDAHLRD